MMRIQSVSRPCERSTYMKLWLEGNQRCCDRLTAIELGGEKYANKAVSLIYHFDEFILIVDDESDSAEEKGYEQ